MDYFIDTLAHMQRTQDRHLERVGKKIQAIAKSAAPPHLMAKLIDELRAREEAKLDPAARELASMIPPCFQHSDRAVYLLCLLISVMATKIDHATIVQVQEGVKAGFELICMIDDVDVVDALTQHGADLSAMRVFAQFLCAMKAWLLYTERLVERTATTSCATPYGHIDAYITARYARYGQPLNSPKSQRKPPAPRPPANE